MSDTIREKIISAVETQLATITIVGGYNTDCGENVQRATPDIASEDMPACNVIPRPDEQTSREYGRQVAVMPIEIQALQVHGEDNCSEVGEAALGDLIKCVMATAKSGTGKPTIDDIEYGGGGIEEYPEAQDPHTIVQAVFRFRYSTLIGNPYQQ